MSTSSTSLKARADEPTPSATPQRELVYSAIREALMVQALPAGQKLSEPEWVARLSVSRTAVREALARLEAEGMIERAATVGYVVPTLTGEDVAEITELRLALESAAIERICERRLTTRAQLAPLHEACDQQAEFIAHGYRLGAREADRRFHQELINLAGNRRLVQMYRRAPLPLIHRALSTPPPGRPPITAVQEHREILAAMAKRDAEQARGLLRSHLMLGVAGLSQ